MLQSQRCQRSLGASLAESEHHLPNHNRHQQKSPLDQPGKDGLQHVDPIDPRTRPLRTRTTAWKSSKNPPRHAVFRSSLAAIKGHRIAIQCSALFGG